MFKKALTLLLTLTLVLSMSGCTELFGVLFFSYLVTKDDDRADKDEIFEFVRENEEKLMQAIEAEDFSAFENKGPIKEIYADEDVVDFSCGSSGMSVSGCDVGFFYTPDNDMTAHAWAPSCASELKPSGNGFKSWDGGVIYYTEHICGNIYYYEISY